MKSKLLAALILEKLRQKKGTRINLPYLDESQNLGAGYLCEVIDIFGGALLADGVGSGKTRMALAVAKHKCSTIFSPTILVLGPARVKEQWVVENNRFTRLDLIFKSHHYLSRIDMSDHFVNVDFVIVDEAHRFRNPKAKRSLTLGSILRERPCLLLSATPLVNSHNDLLTLMRYFLDDRDARRLLGIDPSSASPSDLRTLLFSFTLRRPSSHLPTLHVETLSYSLSPEERAYWAFFSTTLQKLSFEVLKKEWSAGLIRFHLTQQLRLGLPALLYSLKSLRNYHEMWLEARRHNKGMNRKFFKDFFPKGQLPMHFLFPDEAIGDEGLVFDELNLLRTLIQGLSKLRSSSEDRIVKKLREGDKTIVFTSRIEVADSLFRRISQENMRAGLVTSKSTKVTGLGAIDFYTLIEGFQQEDLRNSIQVLVATECLSEGISFPDCAHIILADIPDTALKIEQRVGRIVRKNSSSQDVFVALPQPLNWSESNGLLSRYAIEKANISAKIGLHYPLANKILNTKNLKSENPFLMFIEIEKMADKLDTTESLTPPLFLHVRALPPTRFDRLSFVEIFDDEGHVETHWIGVKDNHILLEWSAFKNELLSLMHDKRIVNQSTFIPLGRVEKNYLDTLINKKNAIRFAPTFETEISRVLFERIRRFALEKNEREHLKKVLFGIHTKGRRQILERLKKEPDRVILRTLLALGLPKETTLLFYKAVITIEYLTFSNDER